MISEEKNDRLSLAAAATVFTTKPASSNHVAKIDQPKKMHTAEDKTFWEYCDNCGTPLQSFRCRLVCPKCGFFHSCSEP
jgi:hypothetical protein